MDGHLSLAPDAARSWTDLTLSVGATDFLLPTLRVWMLIWATRVRLGLVRLDTARLGLFNVKSI